MESNMTGKIGPHEGQEIALMRAGKKHVGMFCEQIFYQEDEYAELLSSDDFSEFFWEDIWDYEGNIVYLPNWIIFRKSHKSDAIELMERVNHINFWDEVNERRIGEILGYSPKDIEAFISQLKTNGRFDRSETP